MPVTYLQTGALLTTDNSRSNNYGGMTTTVVVH